MVGDGDDGAYGVAVHSSAQCQIPEESEAVGGAYREQEWVMMRQPTCWQWYDDSDNDSDTVVVVYSTHSHIPVHSHGQRLEVGVGAYWHSLLS